MSPSGRLPVTFYPNNYTSMILHSDMHMRPWPGRTHRFLQVSPVLPFGFGLSYTTWAYSLNISRGSSALLQVAVSVSNTGGMAADDAVLLFLFRKPPEQGGAAASSAPAAATVSAACQGGAGAWAEGEPLQNLVGFGRVGLPPGGSASLSFGVEARDLAAFAATRQEQPSCGRYYLRVDGTVAAVDLVPPSAERWQR